MAGWLALMNDYYYGWSAGRCSRAAERAFFLDLVHRRVSLDDACRINSVVERINVKLYTETAAPSDLSEEGLFSSEPYLRSTD